MEALTVSGIEEKNKKGVGPSQLMAIAGKASGKGARVGGISAFLMAKEGR